MNSGGAVGASELLKSASKEIIELDYRQSEAELCSAVSELLAQRDRLAEVGARAAQKATSWTEAANAKSLAGLLEKVHHAAMNA